MLSGVPQSTVLGPLLFLVYINDLTTGISSNIRLFADDCIIYREIKKDEDHAALQHDLDLLGAWENKWQMKFNKSKCYIMHITNKLKPRLHTYTMGGANLDTVKEHPTLGLQFKTT